MPTLISYVCLKIKEKVTPNKDQAKVYKMVTTETYLNQKELCPRPMSRWTVKLHLPYTLVRYFKFIVFKIIGQVKTNRFHIKPKLDCNSLCFPKNRQYIFLNQTPKMQVCILQTKHWNSWPWNNVTLRRSDFQKKRFPSWVHFFEPHFLPTKHFPVSRTEL